MDEPAGRLGEPVVVAEYDHLPGLGQLGQHRDKAVDLSRVHRLYGVGEADAPERAGVRRAPGQQQRHGGEPPAA